MTSMGNKQVNMLKRSSTVTSSNANPSVNSNECPTNKNKVEWKNKNVSMQNPLELTAVVKIKSEPMRSTSNAARETSSNKQKMFNCSICNGKFTTAFDLGCHILAKHAGTEPELAMEWLQKNKKF